VRSRRHLPRLRLIAASCILGVPFLLGSSPQAAPAARPGDEAPAGGGPLPFRAAAEAMRRHDCGAALAALPALPPGSGGATSSERSLASLFGGFYAQTCGETALAEERLFGARMRGGLFEDWRLLLLAESARSRGHVLVAKAALAKLLGDYPASPLRPRALVRAAALDWEQSDAEGALALVRHARKEGLPGAERSQLDSLAWEIGSRLGDAKMRTEAARELLVHSPLAASQLGVVEAFRRPDGALSWTSFLTAAQLRLRAQALLALQLEPSALAALDEVPPAERDLKWTLLKAEVLTRANRGAEALALLQPLQSGGLSDGARGGIGGRLARLGGIAGMGGIGGSGGRGHDPAAAPSPAQREVEPLFSGQQRAALEWALAQASDDAAAAQRGHSARAQAERRKLRLAARLHLRSAAESGADPDLATRVLRALYVHLVDEHLFDQALETVRKLRALDPKDTVGASLLWSRGWQDFTRANYAGAVATWSELTALYPDDSSGRRARYWIARCYEVQGQHDRARQLYTELAAADTSDFYRRYAVARLARLKAPPPAAAEAAHPAEPWPDDPALIRAQLLSDFGLDELAQSELDLVRDRAQPRSVAALQGLVFARRGERRKSVMAVHEAFPALGGPFQAAVPEEALKLYYPLDFERPIRASAAANGLPPALVFGVIRQESAFDANAQSRAGASGLMQLMPGTARELARGLGLSWSRQQLSDPSWNVQVGTSYLRQVIAMFGGNLELALAGYNGGPYRIKRLWREAGGSDLDRFLEGLSIEESKIYVKRILVLSDSYRRLYPHAAG
jgi:soluble lytic murein transglycosylase-like protein